MGRIVVGTNIPLGPAGLGYYEAKVEIYSADFQGTANSTGEVGWKVNGLSTFFPDSWSKERLLEELALAFKNKKYDKYNRWIGTVSDGVDVVFHIDNNIIKSAHPKL